MDDALVEGRRACQSDLERAYYCTESAHTWVSWQRAVALHDMIKIAIIECCAGGDYRRGDSVVTGGGGG